MYFIYLILLSFCKEVLCLILRSIMLCSSVNGYCITVIELSLYGRLIRPITFLLWNHENMSWSCDVRRSQVKGTWSYMAWKTFFFFSDTSVWMTKSMGRVVYESQRTWMFISGLLFTCTLIITCCMKCTDYWKNWSSNVAVWGHGAYILRLHVLIVATRKLF
jgi:hypothetical protein